MLGSLGANKNTEKVMIHVSFCKTDSAQEKRDVKAQIVLKLNYVPRLVKKHILPIS